MSLLAKQGTFNSATATGDQDITDVGFQPKVVILMGSFSTASGESANLVFGFGAGISSSSRRAVTGDDEDALGTSDCFRKSATDECISIMDGTGAIGQEADFVTMLSNGFRINWGVANGTARKINYLAIGGDDFTNAFLGSGQFKTTTGLQSYSGVGFQGSDNNAAVLFFQVPLATTETVAVATGVNNYLLGFATRASGQYYHSGKSEDAAGNSDTNRFLKLAKCIGISSQTADTIIVEADFVAWEANGFKLNFTTVSGSAQYFYYLVLKGGSYAVKNFSYPASTGNQSIIGVGFKPKALIDRGSVRAGEIVAQDARGFIGFWESSSSRSFNAISSNDGVTTMDTFKDWNDAKCFTIRSAATHVLEAEGDFVSQDADGFTINHSTVEGSAFNDGFLAMGDNIAVSAWLPVGERPVRRLTPANDTNVPFALPVIVVAAPVGVDAWLPSYPDQVGRYAPFREKPAEFLLSPLLEAAALFAFIDTQEPAKRLEARQSGGGEFHVPPLLSPALLAFLDMQDPEQRVELLRASRLQDEFFVAPFFLPFEKPNELASRPPPPRPQTWPDEVFVPPLLEAALFAFIDTEEPAGRLRERRAQRFPDEFLLSPLLAPPVMVPVDAWLSVLPHPRREPQRPNSSVGLFGPELCVEIRTIKHSGGDYPSIGAWETATANSPCIEIGEIYDDGIWVEAPIFDATLRAATKYRSLRAAPGHEYDLVTDTGVRIKQSAFTVVNIGEAFFKLVGIYVENTHPGDGSTRQAVALTTNGDNALVDRCVAHIGTGGTGPRYGFRWTTGEGRVVRNSIAIGAGGSGANVGFDTVANAGNALYNCVAYGIDSGTSGTGFTGVTVKQNCIAMDCFTDFSGAGGQDHNCSSDASAAGTGSIINQNAADIFVSPSTNDFHLKIGSAATDAGVDLSAFFTNDLDDAQRLGPWDMGAYTATFVPGVNTWLPHLPDPVRRLRRQEPDANTLVLSAVQVGALLAWEDFFTETPIDLGTAFIQGSGAFGPVGKLGPPTIPFQASMGPNNDQYEMYQYQSHFHVPPLLVLGATFPLIATESPPYIRQPRLSPSAMPSVFFVEPDIVREPQPLLPQPVRYPLRANPGWLSLIEKPGAFVVPPAAPIECDEPVLPGTPITCDSPVAGAEIPPCPSGEAGEELGCT